LKAYRPSLEMVFAHVDQSGNVTVVDGNGIPIDAPPVISQKETDEKGNVSYFVSYPGDSASGRSYKLSPYKSSLTDHVVHIGQDGELTVINNNGQALESPPILTKVVDKSGNVTYKAQWPGWTGESFSADLTVYSAVIPVDTYSVHTGSDGSYTVLDQTGKPVENPPLVTKKIVDASGALIFEVSYPGGKPVNLKAYLPGMAP